MRGTVFTLVTIAALAALGCEGPDPERDGFLLVDEGARAAGIEVEVSGERHAGELPVAVPEGAEAAVIRPEGPEPVVVGPGELVQVTGDRGALIRGDAPTDHFWVRGDEARVAAFADLIGASARPLPGGGWAVEGPNAFILASLMGGMPEVGAIAMEPPSDGVSVAHVGLFLGPAATAREPAPAPTGPTPDAAALVGLYAHGDVSLLLDAAGGYTLFTSDPDHPVRRGTYHARPGGVDFIPADGGETAVMELEGERLVDDLGVDFAP